MFMIEEHLTLFITMAGTFSFAISGIRLASVEKIDWFGAYIIGFVTAVGGGTFRDLLLGVTPFWMLDSSFLIITAIGLIATLLFKNNLFKWANTLFLFDAVGLGLFTIAGITKSLDAGWPFWVCIVMGTITGTVGGVVRDVLLNRVPLLFRKDIYALACVIGGVVYVAGVHFNVASGTTEIAAALTIILLRLVAVRFHIHLPQLQPLSGK